MTDYQKVSQPRVLVIALSGIGNLLMQTPLLKKLKTANPTAEISVMIGPRGTKEVLDNNPNIKNVFLGYAKPHIKQRLEMLRVIRKEKFDIGIVAFPGQLITSSSLLYCGAIKQRIGHRYDYYFLNKTKLFLTNSFSVLPVHDVQQNINLLQALNINTDPENTEYDFPLSPNDRLVAQTFLENNKITSDQLIGIHPGTNADMAYKRWPADRWAKLADLLAEQFKAQILIFGGPGEKDLKIEVAKQMRHKPHDVTLSLCETAALIGKCGFFVSNDSGLMHVAVSQKVSTFGLFGPTDETRTAPWGPFGHVIRAANTSPSYNVARLRQIKKNRNADPSLLALDVNTVFDRIVG